MARAGVRGARRTGWGLAAAAALAVAVASCPARAGTAPYPPSAVIPSVSWDLNTAETAAPGSDQWPVSWCVDGNLYATWGDGGGFNGTNNDGRVSLGVARIEGTPPAWQGFNVWGGKNPESPQQTIEGKARILCIDGALVLWAVKQDTWDWARIARSTDLGMSWTVGDFILELPLNRFNPVQFGQDYAGARDDYVYGYFMDLDGASLCLARVDRSQIGTRSAYQVVSGFDGSGQPIWSADLAARIAVFVDAGGINWGYQAVYHPVAKRYLLTVSHGGPQGEGPGLGIFEAPEPWGPWHTVHFEDQWKDDLNKFCFSFPQKWMSPDGTQAWMIHSGWPEYDSYNHLAASFTLVPGAGGGGAGGSSSSGAGGAAGGGVSGAGGGGLGGGSSAGGAVGGPAAGDEEGGCGCRLLRGGERSGRRRAGWWLLLVATAGAGWRRRHRRSGLRHQV